MLLLPQQKDIALDDNKKFIPLHAFQITEDDRPGDMRDCFSIHCSRCKKFSLLQPVTRCKPAAFFCHETDEYDIGLLQLQYNSILAMNHADASLETRGGLQVELYCKRVSLVNQVCDFSGGCRRPTLCTACQTNQNHLSRPVSTFVSLQSHCPSCELTFCLEHAWLSTICHHM